jgi:hypothetical protein
MAGLVFDLTNLKESIILSNNFNKRVVLSNKRVVLGKNRAAKNVK